MARQEDPGPVAGTFPISRDPAAVRRRIEAMEHLLEHAFAIPGTNRRIGLDVVLDLIPVVGDAAAAARASLLTPLVKAYGTDVGVEVTSLAVQVHGGMGYIEETGAAQHYRDARIAPIYEGTNGIQAADLVGRKLGLEGGAAFARLIDEIVAEARDSGEDCLEELAEEVRSLGQGLARANPDDALAASYPFLTMCSVATAGWLMARQRRIAEAAGGDSAFLAMKRAAATYYLERILPEALGLRAHVTGGAGLLYGVDEEAFAA